MKMKKLNSSLLILLPLFLGACSNSEKSPEVNTSKINKPNIIYILADDLGYNEVGAYGQTKIRTPNIDLMAQNGIKFTQHYSGSPVCAPARSTFVEGKHTGKSTVRGNYSKGSWTEELGQFPLPAGTRTIGNMFQEKGYTTALIGKWGLGGPGSTGLPNKLGFDHFFGYLDQKRAHNYYPTHLWRNDMVVMLNNKRISGGVDGLGGAHLRLAKGLDENDPASYKKFTQNDFAPDLMAKEALSFIRNNKDKPFFLYFPVTIPHVSLQVPEDSLKEYEGAFPETPYTGRDQGWLSYTPHRTPRAAYAAMVTRMDRYVGQINALLKELNLDENTLVIFTSDNGPTFNGGSDSKFFESAGPLRGLKGDVYDGGIRVPFIATWPGKIKPSQTSTLVSAQWDMMATFADIIGGKPNEDHTGVSMTPTFFNQGKQQEHDYLYWELGNGQAVRLGDWKGVRMNVMRDAHSPVELYNLATDIGEKHNVAEQHPEIVQQIHDIMMQREPALYKRWNFDIAPLNK